MLTTTEKLLKITKNYQKIHEPWEDEDDESDKHIKARVLEVTRA